MFFRSTIALVLSLGLMSACSENASKPPVNMTLQETVDNALRESKPGTIGVDQFLGHWQSGQDAFGRPAISTMVWSSTLEGQFIQLDYAINAVTDGTQSPMFSGVAYYKAGDGPTVKAFWADTTGDLHPIKATIEGSVMTSIWGIPGEKLGKTRYALSAEGTIRVTDWIMRDGEYRQFNDNVFLREKGSH